MFKEILLDEAVELYADYYNRASFKTIYHHPQYLLAEEKAEKYSIYIYIYLYEEEKKFVIFPSVKRKINDLEEFTELEQTYYDLKTPHEYSGIIASEYDIEHIKKFYLALCSFCKINHIIFSFIRFNPYSDEELAALGYTVKRNDEQIWIDCMQEDITDEFSKSLRRDYKYALKHGLICSEVDKNSSNIYTFEELYIRAMDRLSAKSFFYFNEQYFNDLLQADFTRLYFVYDEHKENVLAAAIVLLDEFNKRAYYHLSCRKGGKSVSGIMELLITTFSQELKKQGYQCIHLGGGATESLRKFKAKFSNRRIGYYIGYQIFDRESYQQLCDVFCGKNTEISSSDFLPLYRCKE